MQAGDYIKGRTAIITGLSKGIGKALAQGLLEKGATVIGWGLNAPDYSHERLHFIECDLTEEGQIRQAMSQTRDLTDRVDFLINNAGFGYFAPVESFSMEKFREMLDLNVSGLFLATQMVAPLMKDQGSGHIVNMSSIAGRVGAPQGAGYNASKFAVSGMSESLFHELRPFGIKVTTVYPGSTKTHFFDDIPNYTAHDNMMDPVELADMIIHLLDTSPNFLVREIEMRPLISKRPK